MSSTTNSDILDGGRRLPLVEDFYTIQGEGYHTGKPAYFIRLGGCDVGCKWCDAKYTWNPRIYPPVDVETVVARAKACAARSIVITGGEPLLYPLGTLTSRLRAEGLEIFLETSGTHPFSGEFDWVCLSPKRQHPPLAEAFGRAHELKVTAWGVTAGFSCSPSGAATRRYCRRSSIMRRRIRAGAYRCRRINSCIYPDGAGRGRKHRVR